MRLNQYLARAGICSRREADRLTQQGQVSVNGQVAVCGMQVSDGDTVAVRGQEVREAKAPVVLAFYKPAGVVCTEHDPHAEETIFDYIDYPERVTYAGRLDKESEGLLLLTNDGVLSQAMMKGGHQKEYSVRVHKPVTQEFLSAIEQGVFLEDLGVMTKPCQAYNTGSCSFQLILTQGLNRQIRRMCHAFGYSVKSLKRIRVMSVKLGDLATGEYRELSKTECRQLYEEAGLSWKN